MKPLRYSLVFAAILAVFVTQILLAPSAHAGSILDKKTVSFTITAYMTVDCTQHPSTAILANWVKYHICGYGTDSNSAATPDGSVQGTCGTVSNKVIDDGGGVAQSQVTISPSLVSGGMFSAYYTGFYSSSSGIDGGFGNVNAWAPFPSFGWTDPQNYYTDTGTADFEVTAEAAMTTILGECTLVAPISASAQINKR